MHLQNDIRVLGVLSQFEIDVVKAYDQCLPHITDASLRIEIARMKADQERHILEMGETLRVLSVQPPRYAQDLQGYLMAAASALRSGVSSAAAAHSLVAFAKAALTHYDAALKNDLGMDVASMLAGNRADIRRHLDVLETLAKPDSGSPVTPSEARQPPAEPR